MSIRERIKKEPIFTIMLGILLVLAVANTIEAINTKNFPAITGWFMATTWIIMYTLEKYIKLEK